MKAHAGNAAPRGNDEREKFNPIRQASGRRLSAADDRRIVRHHTDAVAPQPERRAA